MKLIYRYYFKGLYLFRIIVFKFIPAKPPNSVESGPQGKASSLGMTLTIKLVPTREDEQILARTSQVSQGYAINELQ